MKASYTLFDAAVSSPLPDCMVTMLKDNLLLNAKRDALASVKASLGGKECQDVLGRRKDAAKRAFDKMCKADASTAGASKKGGAQLSMDAFCQDLFDRGVAKEAVITPTSPVKGKKLPEVRTNLSMIDVKGAFVTSQKVEKNNAATTINRNDTGSSFSANANSNRKMSTA